MAVARLPDVVAFETVTELRPRILALLEEGDCRYLVLDLSHIDCFDSSVLAMLLGARQRGQATGTALTLAAPTPLISRMPNITQAIAVLSVAPSVHEALRPHPRDTRRLCPGSGSGLTNCLQDGLRVRSRHALRCQVGQVVELTMGSAVRFVFEAAGVVGAPGWSTPGTLALS